MVFDYLIVPEYAATMDSKKGETTVLNLRDMPRELIAKMKAIAALDGASLKDYVTEVLQQHVQDLEKRGHLPKAKR